MPDQRAVDEWVRRNAAARTVDRKDNLESEMSECLEAAIRLSRMASELEANVDREVDSRVDDREEG
jgi:hypothetical protein